jgi:L-asparaginase
LEGSLRAAPELFPALDDSLCPDVSLLKLAPGTNPKIFGALVDLGAKGIVMEAFGAGNSPCRIRDLPAGVRRAVAAGVPVIVRSQCARGPVDLETYETGAKLRDAGAISAGDMTTEAAVTKLMWALAKTRDLAAIEKIFRTNYAGEITA